MSLFASLFGGAPKPATPWFESDELEGYLARSRFDSATEAFIRDFASDGVAAVDLGDVARDLCDQAVAETESYFVDGVGRVGGQPRPWRLSDPRPSRDAAQLGGAPLLR